MNRYIIIIFLIVIFLASYFYFQKSTVDDLMYNVIEIENVFTPQECQKIIELARNDLEDSTVWSNKRGGRFKDEKYRTSKQAWVNHNSSSVVQKALKINKELLSKQGVLKHGKVEEVQVVNYQPGGNFKPHYDAGKGNYGSNPEINNRYYTMIIYLNDNYTGGKTCFPKINKCVIPKQGKVVLFKNIDENGLVINQSLHEGSSVETGEKWIANLWTHL